MKYITLTKNDYRRVCETKPPRMTSVKKISADEFLPEDKGWGAKLTRWLMRHNFITITKITQKAVGRGN